MDEILASLSSDAAVFDSANLGFDLDPTLFDPSPPPLGAGSGSGTPAPPTPGFIDYLAAPASPGADFGGMGAAFAQQQQAQSTVQVAGQAEPKATQKAEDVRLDDVDVVDGSAFPGGSGFEAAAAAAAAVAVPSPAVADAGGMGDIFASMRAKTREASLPMVEERGEEMSGRQAVGENETMDEVDDFEVQEVPVLSPKVVDKRRVELRGPAEMIVAEAWRRGEAPGAFVVRARKGLSSEGRWGLTSAGEGALLDALMARITATEAASTRYIGYLRYALVAGLVTQRGVLEACVGAGGGAAPRVRYALARLLADILPHFVFTAPDDGLSGEAKLFLAAFAFVTGCGAESPDLVPAVSSLLTSSRLIALARAAGRRNPSSWAPIHGALSKIEARRKRERQEEDRKKGVKGEGDVGEGKTASAALQQQHSAVVELETGIGRLRHGLCFGITTFKSIAELMERPNINMPGEKSLLHALSSVGEVASLVFGVDVGKSLQAIWSTVDPVGGDLYLLTEINHQAYKGSSAGPLARYGFRDRIRACEAIVRYLAECATNPDHLQQWLQPWGGQERLRRLLRDALPQIKADLLSEFSCLMVATAIVGSVVLCLGPSLQLDDPNNGIAVADPVEKAAKETMDQEVEDWMMELSGFAVACLEEAALAEEAPQWRSLGVWILLLSSRCGCLLRASHCNHSRASKVLLAWGGSPANMPNGPASSQAASHQYHHHQAALQARSNALAASAAKTAGGPPPPALMSQAGNKGPNNNSAASGSNLEVKIQKGPDVVMGSAPSGPTAPPSGQPPSGQPPSHPGHAPAGSSTHPSHAGPSYASSSPTEAVSNFAASTALAVLDASDSRGDNSTIRCLCKS